MLAIKVSIDKCVDDDGYPTFVQCHVIGQFGGVQRFIEKEPVVADPELRSDSTYPQLGVVACQITARGHDEVGREVVEIDTSTPWGVESTDGRTRFHVFCDQIIEVPRP